MEQSLSRPYKGPAAGTGNGRVAPAGTSPAMLAGGALLALSALLFAANTRYGLSIEPDTTRYMGISPQSYDAPVYHWLLTGGANWGIGLLTAAMAVAIVTLIANVLLVYGLLLRTTGRWPVTTAGTALIVVSPQFVGLHAAAMSEAPFLSFMLLSIWFFLNYIERAKRGDLVWSAVMLALASLTRFTAPPLGAAMALALLLDRRRPFAQRLADCLLLAGVSGALFFAWIGWSQATAGRSIGRELAFHGNQGAAEWRGNLESVLAWVLPAHAGMLPRLVMVLAVIGFAITQVFGHVRQWRHAEQNDTSLALCMVLALLIPGYLGFIYLSTTIEANLTFDGRYALPAYLFIVMLLTVTYARLDSATTTGRWLRTALVALAGVVLVSHATRTAVHTRTAWAEGTGYNAAIWRNSPTIAAVRRLPADALIYTNGADVVAIQARRSSLFSPETMESRTGKLQPGNEVPAQIDRVRQQAQDRPVYVVFFDRIDWRFYLVDESTLVQALALPTPESLSDGRIYRVPATTPATTSVTEAQP